MFRKLIKYAIPAALVILAPPALAGGMSSHERQELIGNCIRQSGQHYADRCVEIIDRKAAGRRALWDYYSRPGRDRESLERECWSNPKIINPTRCAAGFPPVYSD